MKLESECISYLHRYAYGPGWASVITMCKYISKWTLSVEKMHQSIHMVIRKVQNATNALYI